MNVMQSCLRREPKERATINDLLQHDFLKPKPEKLSREIMTIFDTTPGNNLSLLESRIKVNHAEKPSLSRY